MLPPALKAMIFTLAVFGAGALWMLLVLVLFTEFAARYIDYRLDRREGHEHQDHCA